MKSEYNNSVESRLDRMSANLGATAGSLIRRARTVSWRRWLSIIVLFYLLATGVWVNFIDPWRDKREERRLFAQLAEPIDRKMILYEELEYRGISAARSDIQSAVEWACRSVDDGNDVFRIASALHRAGATVVDGIDNADAAEVLGLGIPAYCPEKISALIQYREHAGNYAYSPRVSGLVEGFYGG